MFHLFRLLRFRGFPENLSPFLYSSRVRCGGAGWLRSGGAFPAGLSCLPTNAKGLPLDSHSLFRDEDLIADAEAVGFG
jgi:hypothetical protein